MKIKFEPTLDCGAGDFNLKINTGKFESLIDAPEIVIDQKTSFVVEAWLHDFEFDCDGIVNLVKLFTTYLGGAAKVMRDAVSGVESMVDSIKGFLLDLSYQIQSLHSAIHSIGRAARTLLFDFDETGRPILHPSIVEKVDALVRHAEDADLSILEKIAHAHVQRAVMDHMKDHPPSSTVLSQVSQIKVIKHLYRTLKVETSAEFIYEGGLPFVFSKDLLEDLLKDVLGPQELEIPIIPIVFGFVFTFEPR